MSQLSKPIAVRPLLRRCFIASQAVLLAVSLGGCETVALTALGIGASQGVSHTLNGICYRTFTLPANKVKGATLAALERMGIRVGSTGKTESGELIVASSSDRQIEVELEPISAKTTRMRVTAKTGPFLYDSATATEIIMQTERVIGNTRA